MTPKTNTADAVLAGLLREHGVAAWRQIVDEIEHDIIAGRLPPGAQIPTEAQLAGRFKVNRHTVRRALAVLASRGIVRATQGRGTFVEAKPLPYLIGGKARFAENVTSAGREASSELLEAAERPADEHVAEALAIARGAPVLRLETLRRADRTPIAFGLVHVPLPRFAGFERRFARSGSITRALRALGVADYTRLRTGVGARTAGTDEARRLEITPGRVVLVTEGVNVDSEGARILFIQSTFPADRVELIVKAG